MIGSTDWHGTIWPSVVSQGIDLAAFRPANKAKEAAQCVSGHCWAQ